MREGRWYCLPMREGIWYCLPMREGLWYCIPMGGGRSLILPSHGRKSLILPSYGEGLWYCLLMRGGLWYCLLMRVVFNPYQDLEKMYLNYIPACNQTVLIFFILVDNEVFYKHCIQKQNNNNILVATKTESFFPKDE